MRRVTGINEATFTKDTKMKMKMKKAMLKARAEKVGNLVNTFNHGWVWFPNNWDTGTSYANIPPMWRQGAVTSKSFFARIGIMHNTERFLYKVVYNEPYYLLVRTDIKPETMSKLVSGLRDIDGIVCSYDELINITEFVYDSAAEEGYPPPTDIITADCTFSM